MIIKPTDNTKTKIIKSTILLFNEYGPMVPMSKISELAGVAAGTPFKYYKTKDELLLDTYHYARLSVKQIKQEDPLAKPDAEGMIKAIVRDILRWSALFPHEHQYVEKYEDAVCYDYFSDAFSLLYEGIVKELGIWERIKDDVRPDIPPEIISRMISVHCSVFSRYMSHHGVDFRTKEATALLDASADSIWNSIKKQ